MAVANSVLDWVTLERVVLCTAVCQGELSRKQTNQVIATLLEDLIAGIRTPERPCSPLSTNITDEELFRQRNPKVRHYCV